MPGALGAAAMCLALLMPASAYSHALSPGLLVLQQRADHTVLATWRQSSLKPPGTPALRPILPEGCRMLAAPQVSEDGTTITESWALDCGERGLIGQRIAIDGLTKARTDALVRVELADGRTIRGVVGARSPSFHVPEHESKATVARSYAVMGVVHILSGADHLLFVFGLLLLVRSLRALAATITAFTIGHSITLSLAALGIATAPAGPVEVLIAVSIYVLAVELSREHRAGATLFSRNPWGLALLFGLLHGLGFAGALKEAGLPDHEIPLALLSFNAGIEVGQLAFVLAIAGLRRTLRPLLAELPPWIGRVPVYALGSLAAFWVLERSTVLF